MKSWIVKFLGEPTVTQIKIRRVIFQRDTLSLLLFVIAMMPVNYILRKYTGGYRFTKLPEKINHPMYMNDIKILAKNEKECV